MFVNWLNEIDKKNKAGINIGVLALCGSIWTYKNNFVFSKTRSTIFCRLSIWQHAGSIFGLSNFGHIGGNLYGDGCNMLLMVAQDIYNYAS
jgi:hypothetical protein